AAQGLAHVRRHASSQRGVVEPPENGVARVGGAVRVVKSGDIPTLFIDRDDRTLIRRKNRGRELAHLFERLDVVAEETHPREPLAQSTLKPVGQGRADKTRQQSAAYRAHPLTAPATSPCVIRPWMMRKKMMTGIDMSV